MFSTQDLLAPHPLCARQQRHTPSRAPCRHAATRVERDFWCLTWCCGHSRRSAPTFADCVCPLTVSARTDAGNCSGCGSERHTGWSGTPAAARPSSMAAARLPSMAISRGPSGPTCIEPPSLLCHQHCLSVPPLFRSMCTFQCSHGQSQPKCSSGSQSGQPKPLRALALPWGSMTRLVRRWRPGGGCVQHQSSRTPRPPHITASIRG